MLNAARLLEDDRAAFTYVVKLFQGVLDWSWGGYEFHVPILIPKLQLMIECGFDFRTFARDVNYLNYHL